MQPATNTHQDERATEIIAREAAEFIAREARHTISVSGEAASDSLITVIRAESVAHGERVNVFVSVFPEEKARGALAFLERQREAFSNHLKQHTHVRLPRVDFLLNNREQLGERSKI